MSEKIPGNPLVGNVFGDAHTIEPPEEQLESYFQGHQPLVGDGATSCCPEEEAEDSPGSPVPPEFKDLALKDVGLILLAKCGQRLATFKGTGVIHVKNGVASLQKAVPIKVRQLWHRFVNLNGAVVPAEPKPAPFLAIADDCGEVHAVGSHPDGPSMMLNNRDLGGWNATLTGYLPKDHIGAIDETPLIQLTGYRPLSPLGDEKVRRDLEVLGGEGVIMVTKMQAPPSSCDCCGDQCCCEGKMQSVAQVVPFPTIDESNVNITYVLEYHNYQLTWGAKECCCPQTSCVETSIPCTLGNSL